MSEKIFFDFLVYSFTVKMITTFCVIAALVEAGGIAGSLTKNTLKQGLQDALAIERTFKIRERLGHGLGVGFAQQVSARDVAQFAKITFEAISRGEDVFSESDKALLARRIARIRDASFAWMRIATSKDSDEESLYTGRGKLFTLLFDFIWPRLTNDLRELVAVEHLSVDLLTWERIEIYIAESLGNEIMYDFFTHGVVPEDPEKVYEEARERAGSLAAFTYSLLERSSEAANPVLSEKDKESVVLNLVQMCESNVLFAQIIRVPNFIVEHPELLRSSTGIVSRLSLVIEKYLDAGLP